MGMLMTVTQVEPTVGALNRVADSSGSGGGFSSNGISAHVNLSDIAITPDSADKLSNPAAIGDQVMNGLRDLMLKSEHINQTLGADFQRAQDRVHARETQAAIGAPGLTGLLATSGASGTSHGGFPESGMMSRGTGALPGPAEMHPGLNSNSQWEKLRDEQDRAFIRYNEFAAYELQSSELQKITEQLSTAVNTLVRSQ